MAAQNINGVRVVTGVTMPIYECSGCKIWRQVGEKKCPICSTVPPALPGDNVSPKTLAGTNAASYIAALDQVGA